MAARLPFEGAAIPAARILLDWPRPYSYYIGHMAYTLKLPISKLCFRVETCGLGFSLRFTALFNLWFWA